MKIQATSRTRRQAGYSALFITLVLVGASLMVLGATLSRSTSSSRLTDRNTSFLAANGAAEAAVEKALSRMLVDFANGGESLILTNLSLYQTSVLPTAAGEFLYWTNFTWSDGQGHDNQIYVARLTQGTNAPYVALEEQYAGLSGYASTYRIVANVAMKSTSYGYSFTNAVQYDLQLAQIPVFQFAIFYNGLLEFSDNATLIVSGPVHATDSNIFVGSPSDLTFNSTVTDTGNITKPANAGYTTNTWSGAVNYNGSPTPGYLNAAVSLNLPIGTSSTSGTNVQQILYYPQTNDTTAMSQQRYYNKASMTLIVTNTTFTATFKSALNDASPWIFTTNLTWLTNTTGPATNWAWLSSTNTFYDWREHKNINLTQIDVGLMTNWIAQWVSTNTGTAAKFGPNNPFWIVYVADYRDSNTTTLEAIRLTDGNGLPSAGLTFATPNPLYIWGNYNVPQSGGYLGTTNTTHSNPASVACDALTILSPAWRDYGSATTNYSTNGSTHVVTMTTNTTRLIQNATDTTVNTAIIAGIVPSSGTGSSQFSGGVQNLPRLLEQWSNSGSAVLTLNTSIVCLFNSTWATSPFILPGNYYYAPTTRKFSFDLNYTISSRMPPGTPNICRLNRATWCNPMPGVVNGPSVPMDFVAQ